jgi:hypothetical protein
MMARKFNEWDVVEIDGKRGIVVGAPSGPTRVHTICFGADHYMARYDMDGVRYEFRATPEMVLKLINASDVA